MREEGGVGSRGVPAAGLVAELQGRRKRKEKTESKAVQGPRVGPGGRATGPVLKANPNRSGRSPGSPHSWNLEPARCAEPREANARVSRHTQPHRPEVFFTSNLKSSTTNTRRFGYEGKQNPWYPGTPKSAGAKGNTRARVSARTTPWRSHLRPPARKSLRGRARHQPAASRRRRVAFARPERGEERASARPWRGGASAGRGALAGLPAHARPRHGVPAPLLLKSEVWGITEPVRPAARAGALRPRERARARGRGDACEGGGGGWGSACEGAGAERAPM